MFVVKITVTGCANYSTHAPDIAFVSFSKLGHGMDTRYCGFLTFVRQDKKNVALEACKRNMMQ